MSFSDPQVMQALIWAICFAITVTAICAMIAFWVYAYYYRERKQ